MTCQGCFSFFPYFCEINKFCPEHEDKWTHGQCFLGLIYTTYFKWAYIVSRRKANKTRCCQIHSYAESTWIWFEYLPVWDRYSLVLSFVIENAMMARFNDVVTRVKLPHPWCDWANALPSSAHYAQPWKNASESYSYDYDSVPYCVNCERCFYLLFSSSLFPFLRL